MKEIINHLLCYEFIYLFSFFSLIFLFIAIFIKQKIIKKISILLFSIFFILFCFEFTLSFFMDKIQIEDVNPNFYSNWNSKEITKKHEIKIKSKKDGRTQLIETDNIDKELYEKVYDVIYSDYNGFRYTKCDTNSLESFIFLGCSFIHGDGLNDNETLPYYFSELYDLKKNVLNCGIRGHASNTALNILNNGIFKKFTNVDSKIKHCFYALIYDHIYRNFRILCNEPSDCYILKNRKYVIVQKRVKLKYFFARSYMFRKIFLPIIEENNKQYYKDYLLDSLKEMNKIVKEKYDSKLTIIVWLGPEFDDEFIKQLEETDLDLVFLDEKVFSEEKGYKIKHDGHPTAKANKEIAKILYEHINNKNK